MNRKHQRILLPILLLALLAALFKLEIPGNTIFSKEIQNSAHFPFFGALSLLFFSLSTLFLEKIVRPRWGHYLIAFAATVLAGMLQEYFQIAGPGDADVLDLIRDMMGALTFLGLFMTFDRGMDDYWKKWGRLIKLVFYACALILTIAAFLPSVLWGIAYLHRGAEFPVICGFDSVWEKKFLATHEAVLKEVPAPYTKKGENSNKAAEVKFLRADYPGLTIMEPYPDWSGYNAFDFTVYSDLKKPVNISIRIEDGKHNGEYYDRFNMTFSTNPGVNHISVPLEEIEEGPWTRDMDITNISKIALFAYKPDSEFVLYFDDFRLE